MAQFNFTYTPGTPIDQVIGMEMAGEIWSTFLDDDIDVNIHVGAADLEGDVLGGALPGIVSNTNYNKVSGALENDVVSADDALAVSNLSDGNKFEAQVFDSTISSNDLALSRANAKALDILPNNMSEGDLDGFIAMNTFDANSSIDWYYQHDGGTIQANEVDFVSVAVHEIGHILGFFSGVDQAGWYETLLASTDIVNGVVTDVAALEAELDYATPLDLFRYSAESAGLGALTPALGGSSVSNVSTAALFPNDDIIDTGNSSDSDPVIDLTIGSDAYFSIDGGATRLADFATGKGIEFGGDGYQASHWEADGDDGVMDAVIRLAEQSGISALDLQAFDVIGYDVMGTASLDLAAIEAQAIANSQEAGIFQNRDAAIDKLIAESGVYEKKQKKGGGYGIELLENNGLFSTLEIEETPAGTDESAAVETASGGSSATPSLGDMSADALLGLASAQLSGFSTDTDLEADSMASSVLESDSEGESAPSYQDVLANNLGLLGSDDGVLGDALASPLVGGMLAEMLPQIGVTGEQTFFYGGAFQGSDA